MKSSNKNIDQNIKKKIEEYEFDFSDHAWDKMESLMDPTASADDATPPSRSNFKIFRNLLIMLLLLIVLYMGVQSISVHNNSPDNTPLTTNEVLQQPETTTSTTTINSHNESDNSNDNNSDDTAVQQKSTKAITNQIIQLMPGLAPALAPAIAAEPTPLQVVPAIEDSSLLTRLSQQLGTYQNHFQPEKVYLQFDRTFFKPGESIWFSAYVRDANTLKASPKSDMVYIELNGPNGSNLKKLTLIAKNGSVRGDFQLDKNAKGGLYTIKAYTNWQRNQDHFFERKITVQNAVLPNLRMALNLQREAYGPGDKVEAKLELKDLENKTLAQQDFIGMLMLDGNSIKNYGSKTDDKGIATVTFELPQKLNTTDGLINISIFHKGKAESISRSIPIVLNNIDLQFLPEGGDMINGISGKVAFKAINEFGTAADVAGKILNRAGEEVASFESYHQGMGAFSFVPKEDEYYTAVITKPTGIKKEYALPIALNRGYALNVKELTDSDIQVKVSTTEAEPLLVVLQSHGRIYESETTPDSEGTHLVKFSTNDLPIGIAQLTLFDSKEIPRAERLVFLNPDKKLDISIKTDKEKYMPREKVSMTIEVKDERGMPMPGQFSLAVANDNLLSFADDKQGHILSYFLIESELKGKVEEPNFYFDPAEKHPEKDQLLALDYLMLTQGWRRLNWMDMIQSPAVAMQHNAERASFGGLVVDLESQPIANAAIEIIGTDHKTSTDENGRFLLRGIQLYKHKTLRLLAEKDLVKRKTVVNRYGENYKIILPRAHQASDIAFQRTKTPSQEGTLTGKVITEYGEELIGANVQLKNSNNATSTDFEGNFKLKNIPPGEHEIIITYLGFNNTIASIRMEEDEGLAANITLAESQALALDEVVVTEFKVVPLIEQDYTTQGGVVTGQELTNISSKKRRRKKKRKGKKEKNLDAFAGKAAGTTIDNIADKEISVRGSRSNGTDIYIDGIRVQSPKHKMFINPNASAPSDLAVAKDRRAFSGDVIVKNIEAGNIRGSLKIGQSQMERLNTYAKKFKRGFYESRDFYIPYYEADAEVSVRDDFRQTIFWNPVIEVDRNGKAVVEFFTNDEMTTFRASVEGLTVDGGIGRKTHTFYSQMPFGMDVKIPERVLSGDLVDLPLTLSNNTNKAIDGTLQIEIPEALSWKKDFNPKHQLGPKESKTILLKLEAKNTAATTGDFNIQFLANDYSDAFTKSFEITPRGFPVEEVFSGRDKEKTFEIDVNDPINGTVTAEFNCYPNAAKDLAAGMQRMLRQPNGCFEQTSSSNYPNLLVYDLLKSTNQLDADTKKKTEQFLEAGYKRLTGFEVKGGGFDWYGRPPAHEALTAYGLLQFTDMKAVYPVSEKMLKRTAKWLLSRRDGEGGFKNGKRALHRWEKESPIANAYIVWALTEAGMGKEITKEIDQSYSDAMETKDPYLLALMANTLFELNDKRAKKVMQLLLPLQQEDGSWNGLTKSMTHSGGKNLLIETSSLVTLAILKGNVGKDRLSKAIDFISSSKTSYGFGSTQSTVLAMKALVAFAKTAGTHSESGELALYINKKKVGKLSYEKDQKGLLVFDNLEEYLRNGSNKVKVKFSGTEEGLPWDINLKYNTRQPNSSEACQVDLKTELQANKTKLGETIRMNVTLTNLKNEAIPNTIAKVGIPAGLSLQSWQLKEMQEKGVFDFYEIFDGYVVFHYRGLDANAEELIGLDLKADIPGSYEAPASVAYLYYTNEEESWSKPEVVVIE